MDFSPEGVLGGPNISPSSRESWAGRSSPVKRGCQHFALVFLGDRWWWKWIAGARPFTWPVFHLTTPSERGRWGLDDLWPMRMPFHTYMEEIFAGFYYYHTFLFSFWVPTFPGKHLAWVIGNRMVCSCTICLCQHSSYASLWCVVWRVNAYYSLVLSVLAGYTVTASAWWRIAHILASNWQFLDMISLLGGEGCCSAAECRNELPLVAHTNPRKALTMLLFRCCRNCSTARVLACCGVILPFPTTCPRNLQVIMLSCDFAA